MSTPADRWARLELALVVCTLLLPIPLLAVSGLSIPLPSVVERGIASLLPPPTAGVKESTQPTPPSEGSRADTSAGYGSVDGAGNDTVEESGESPPATPDADSTSAGAAPPVGENTPPTDNDGTSPSQDGDTPPEGAPSPEADEPTTPGDSSVSPPDEAPDAGVKAEAPGVSAAVDPIGDGSGDEVASVGVTVGDDVELNVTVAGPQAPLP